MLKTTIELYPFGLETDKRTLYEITIANVTKDETTPRYEYNVRDVQTGEEHTGFVRAKMNGKGRLFQIFEIISRQLKVTYENVKYEQSPIPYRELEEIFKHACLDDSD